MSIRRDLHRIGLLIVFVFSMFSFGPAVRASDVIPTGHNITDGNTLVSAGGSFTLGFLSPPGSGSGEPPTTKRYLAIWFSFSNVTESICWVANRDNPLNDTSGVLVLTTSGTLLLLDGSNNTVWSSGSPSPNATGARLLDSGNFVVQGGPDNSKTLWHSFDQPCNALLPGMKIGTNKWNGDEWYLSSWQSANDPGTGSYRYITEPGGGGSTPENVLWDGDGTKKYRTGPWNGERFDGVPEMASYSSDFTFHVTTIKDGEVTYSYSAKDGAPYSQLRLSEAGVVQRLVWDANHNKWNPFLKEPRDDCDDYGHCGPFGLCDSTDPSSSLCTCFNGFVPAVPKDWSYREYSGGCRRNVSLDCSSNQSRSSTDGFHVVSMVKLPDTQNATVDMAASLDDCRVRCLANCSCVAFAAANITGVSGCIIWTNSFADLRLIDGGQDLFVRMPISLIDIGGNKKKKFPVVIVASVVTSGAILVAIVITCWFVIVPCCRRRWWKRPPDDPSSSSRPPLPLPIAYQTLHATGSFSRENNIGRGAFGTVYKCQLPNVETTRLQLPVGHMVALKVLKRSDNKMMISYERELSMMSRLTHKNLVELLAYCNDTESAAADEVVLVYKYMRKGSLDHYLFVNRAELSWNQRLQIITSIVEGILYLHVGSGMKIIHRDLKPDNILLDDDWTPKIADFGLAKHFTDPTALHTPFGPCGYMAPECFKRIATDKSDVYSFGVLLLETISGIRNGVMQELLPHAWNSWKNEGNTLNKLLDPQVPNEDVPMLSAKLERCIQIGLLCVQVSPDKRPHIGKVLDMLKTECTLPLPERPTLGPEGQTSNTMHTEDTYPPSMHTEDTYPPPLAEGPTLRPEGQTSNTVHIEDTRPPPLPEGPTLRSEGQTSNRVHTEDTRPPPLLEGPILRPEDKTSNIVHTEDTRPPPLPKGSTLKLEGQTSNILHTKDTRPPPLPEGPTLRPEGQTSNIVHTEDTHPTPVPEGPTLTPEGQTSNTMHTKDTCQPPLPEGPTLRPEGQTSNTVHTEDTHPPPLSKGPTLRPEGQTSNTVHIEDTRPP